MYVVSPIQAWDRLQIARQIVDCRLTILSIHYDFLNLRVWNVTRAIRRPYLSVRFLLQQTQTRLRNTQQSEEEENG